MNRTLALLSLLALTATASMSSAQQVRPAYGSYVPRNTYNASARYVHSASYRARASHNGCCDPCPPRNCCDPCGSRGLDPLTMIAVDINNLFSGVVDGGARLVRGAGYCVRTLRTCGCADCTSGYGRPSCGTVYYEGEVYMPSKPTPAPTKAPAKELQNPTGARQYFQAPANNAASLQPAPLGGAYQRPSSYRRPAPAPRTNRQRPTPEPAPRPDRVAGAGPERCKACSQPQSVSQPIEVSSRRVHFATTETNKRPIVRRASFNPVDAR